MVEALGLIPSTEKKNHHSYFMIKETEAQQDMTRSVMELDSWSGSSDSGHTKFSSHCICPSSFSSLKKVFHWLPRRDQTQSPPDELRDPLPTHLPGLVSCYSSLGAYSSKQTPCSRSPSVLMQAFLPSLILLLSSRLPEFMAPVP